jgi:hypothetical protein
MTHRKVGCNGEKDQGRMAEKENLARAAAVSQVRRPNGDSFITEEGLSLGLHQLSSVQGNAKVPVAQTFFQLAHEVAPLNLNAALSAPLAPLKLIAT